MARMPSLLVYRRSTSVLQACLSGTASGSVKDVSSVLLDKTDQFMADKAITLRLYGGWSIVSLSPHHTSPIAP